MTRFHVRCSDCGRPVVDFPPHFVTCPNRAASGWGPCGQKAEIATDAGRELRGRLNHHPIDGRDLWIVAVEADATERVLALMPSAGFRSTEVDLLRNAIRESR